MQCAKGLACRPPSPVPAACVPSMRRRIAVWARPRTAKARPVRSEWSVCVSSTHTDEPLRFESRLRRRSHQGHQRHIRCLRTKPGDPERHSVFFYVRANAVAAASRVSVAAHGSSVRRPILVRRADSPSHQRNGMPLSNQLTLYMITVINSNCMRSPSRTTRVSGVIARW